MEEEKNELMVQPIQFHVEQGDIITNINAVEEAFKTKIKKYDKYTVEDETAVDEAKKVRAGLNKVKNYVNEKKKEIKKEYEKPYKDIEKRLKSMMKDAEDKSKYVDDQIKVYEQMWKEDRYADIKEHFEMFDLEGVSLDSIFNPKWYNKGYDKKWKAELEEEVKRIQDDLKEIEDSGVENVTQFKLDYLNNGYDYDKAYERYSDRITADKMEETDEEYITIKVSRYEELLDIEKKYKEMKESE